MGGPTLFGVVGIPGVISITGVFGITGIPGVIGRCFCRSRRIIAAALINDIFGRRFAVIAFNEVVRNLLTFVQRFHASVLNRGNMYESILRAVFWFDEAISFGAVKPLNSSSSHYSSLPLSS